MQMAENIARSPSHGGSDGRDIRLFRQRGRNVVGTEQCRGRVALRGSRNRDSAGAIRFGCRHLLGIHGAEMRARIPVFLPRGERGALCGGAVGEGAAAVASVDQRRRGGSFLYACLDELHQSFVAGRDGTFFDVGIDAIGFVVAALLCMTVWYLVLAIRTARTI